jgi:cell division protein FtsZ
VEESADENADVIFGTTTDATLPIDYIKITLVATGFDHEEAPKKAPSVNNDAFDAPAAPEAPASGRTVTRPRMVVGGDLSDDYLDVPTYMRQQKD